MSHAKARIGLDSATGIIFCLPVAPTQKMRERDYVLGRKGEPVDWADPSSEMQMPLEQQRQTPLVV